MCTFKLREMLPGEILGIRVSTVYTHVFHGRLAKRYLGLLPGVNVACQRSMIECNVTSEQSRADVSMLRQPVKRLQTETFSPPGTVQILPCLLEPMLFTAKT